MFGKIIGAVAGSKIAESTRGIGGPGGAVLGWGAASLVRRLSIPTMLVLGAGGYLVKRHMDKKDADETGTRTPPEVKPTAV